MNMRAAKFGHQKFNVTRLHDATMPMDSGEVVFEIELRILQPGQHLFFGLLDAQQPESRVMAEHRGIGVSIDTDSGEVVDVLNAQGVIGYLDDVPMELHVSTFLCLEFEKIKRIYIPKLTVGEEKILHPALHLAELPAMSLVVGTTALGNGAIYENPHLMIKQRNHGVPT
ncbi:MAG: hypothetical protein VCA55_06475 [Verrucomicrobiales bacterium]